MNIIFTKLKKRRYILNLFIFFLIIAFGSCNRQFDDEKLNSLFTKLYEFQYVNNINELEHHLDSVAPHINEFSDKHKMDFYYLRATNQNLYNNFHASLYYSEKARLIGEANYYQNDLIHIYILELSILERMSRYKIIQNQEKLYLQIGNKLKKIIPKIIKPLNTPEENYYIALYYNLCENNIALFVSYLNKVLSTKVKNTTSTIYYIYNAQILLIKRYTYYLENKKKDIDKYIQPKTDFYSLLPLIKDNSLNYKMQGNYYIQLAEYFFETQQYDSLDKYCNKLETVKTIVNPSDIFSKIYYLKIAKYRYNYYQHTHDSILEKNFYTQFLENYLKFFQFSVEKNNLILTQLFDIENYEKRKTNQERTIYLISILLILTISLATYLFFKKQYLATKSKLLVIQSNLDGQNIERKKIATELHDEIAVVLAGLQMKLETIQNSNSDNQSKLFSSLKNQLSYLYLKTRNLSHILNIPEFNDHEFDQLLINLFEEYQINDTLKIDYFFYPISALNKLSEYLKKNIYLLIQELLFNTKKHAQATAIDINIETFNESIRIFYYDNGKGVSPQIITNKFYSIKNRINLLRGNFIILPNTESNSFTAEFNIPK